MPLSHLPKSVPGSKIFQAPAGQDECLLRQIVHPGFINPQRPDEGTQSRLMLAHHGFKFEDALMP